VWALPCEEVEEYEKDIFLQLPKLKNFCVGVAFRKFSSGMREELWERLELLHFSEKENQNVIVASKNHPGIPHCVGMFLVAMQSGHEHTYYPLSEKMYFDPIRT